MAVVKTDVDGNIHERKRGVAQKIYRLLDSVFVDDVMNGIVCVLSEQFMDIGRMDVQIFRERRDGDIFLIMRFDIFVSFLYIEIVLLTVIVAAVVDLYKQFAEKQLHEQRVDIVFRVAQSEIVSTLNFQKCSADGVGVAAEDIAVFHEERLDVVAGAYDFGKVIQPFADSVQLFEFNFNVEDDAGIAGADEQLVFTV